MTLNVLVTMEFPGELLQKLQAVSPEINLSYAPLKVKEPLPLGTLAKAEVLYTWSALPHPEDAPKLRWVQFHSAGIDHLQGHPLLDSNIALTTASGVHAVTIAEYVMASILAWAHRLPRIFAYQQRAIWPGGRWERFVPQELRGATLGIIGYGSVGREVARLARAFGMRVLASKRDPRRMKDEGFRLDGTGDPEGDLPDRVYPAAATLSMLSECNYVVLCVPLVPQTVHLIDEAALRAMKPTTYLINVGRGRLVDEGALIEALQRGLIAGAGLDVFEVEPLSADSPLWKMDNVILSPHVSGFTPRYDELVVNLFSRNLRRYLEKRPLLNLVDRSLGY